MEHVFYRALDSNFWAIRFGLKVLSLLWRAGVFVRTSLYKLGFFKPKKIEIPVISVGNITVGGSGKTPVIAMLAEHFLSKGSVAIVSRGYKRNKQSKEPVVVSKGQGPLVSVIEAGDEPYMLAKRCPKAIVVVHEDRYKACQVARQLGAKIILLDDGFQHWQVARDLDVVVIGGRYPMGKGAVMPAGTLREPLSSLQRADVVLYPQELSEHFVAQIKQKASQAACAPLSYTCPEAWLWDGSAKISLEKKRVGVFCSIGNPDSFVDVVHRLGAIVVASAFGSDHMNITHDKWQLFVKKAAAERADALICTEKDWCRYTSSLSHSIPLAWVKREAYLDEESQRTCARLIDFALE